MCHQRNVDFSRKPLKILIILAYQIVELKSEKKYGPKSIVLFGDSSRSAGRPAADVKNTHSKQLTRFASATKQNKTKQNEYYGAP